METLDIPHPPAPEDRTASPGPLTKFESSTGRFALVTATAILIAVVGSNLIAAWIGLPRPGAAYRRIGPETGPQILSAGSSLLQFGLSWPVISKTLGQGIENWGVGGSTPSEWEVFQHSATNCNLTIVGISAYDLNENHLCNTRANIVPIGRTIQDLYDSQADWQFSKRLLSQYPLAFLRKLLPTAGNSDAVLVGLRRKLPERMRASAAAADRANAMVLPRDAVMDFGGSTERLSDWPKSKILRRLALMRMENQGAHLFNGPKYLALCRMLKTAQEGGHVIIIVVPVAPVYAREFLTKEVKAKFESAVGDLMQRYPLAQFVRLDEVSALDSDHNFSDPVHLNVEGGQTATAVFLTVLKQQLVRK
jgi:hypothetical protein